MEQAVLSGKFFQVAAYEDKEFAANPIISYGQIDEHAHLYFNQLDRAVVVPESEVQNLEHILGLDLTHQKFLNDHLSLIIDRSLPVMRQDYETGMWSVVFHPKVLKAIIQIKHRKRDHDRLDQIIPHQERLILASNLEWSFFKLAERIPVEREKIMLAVSRSLDINAGRRMFDLLGAYRRLQNTQMAWEPGLLDDLKIQPQHVDRILVPLGQHCCLMFLIRRMTTFHDHAARQIEALPEDDAGEILHYYYPRALLHDRLYLV